MSSIPESEAYLIGTFVSAVLYGVLTVLFITSVYDLTARRRTPSVNYFILVSGIMLWGCSTSHLVLCFKRCCDAFFNDQIAGTVAGSYLNQRSDPLWLAGEASFTWINLVSDLILVYRTLLIWNNKYWIVIAPLCSTLGAFVSSTISIVYMGREPPGETISPAPPLILHYADALYGFSLFTNITTTLLIALRIIYLMRTSIKTIPKSHSRHYISVVGIVIESGALTAVSISVFLGFWVNESLLQVMFYLILVQLMAISPMLIVVRASAGANMSNPALSILSPAAQVQPKALGVAPEHLLVLTEVEVHSDAQPDGEQAEDDRRREEDDASAIESEKGRNNL